MTFKVGDKIMYPNNGAGVIEDITDKTIYDDVKKLCYIIEIPQSKLKIIIPVDKAENLGVRKIISAEQFQKVVNILQSRPQTIKNNNKQKKGELNEKKIHCNIMESYKAILRKGIIYEIAKLVRNLSFEKQSLQKQSSRLTSAKNKILVRAISALKEELVMAGMEEKGFKKILEQMNQNIKSIIISKEGIQMSNVKLNILTHKPQKNIGITK